MLIVGLVLALSVCVACGSGNNTAAVVRTSVVTPRPGGPVVFGGRATGAMGAMGMGESADVGPQGLDERAPARPKLMVVFARKDNETAAEAPRTMLLFEDAAVGSAQRRWDEAEPSAQLLPPHGLPGTHQDDYREGGGSPAGYGYPKPQEDDHKPQAGYNYPKPQQDEPKPQVGYNYPKPQQDDHKPQVGYSYPKPQLDDPKPPARYSYPRPQQDDPQAGYNYPKPQQDDRKPQAGYNYPKPQLDDPKPQAGYHYPKPQKDDSKSQAGYNYPKPQQDDSEPQAGYLYPKPQQDALKPEAGYHYPKPQQDALKPQAGYNYPKPQQDDSKPQPQVGYDYPRPQNDHKGYSYLRPSQGGSAWKPLSDQDYLPPKEQQPLDDPSRPPYDNPTTTTNTAPHAPHKLTTFQDELPYSYKENSYERPRQPLQDVSLDSYLPPNQPLRDDAATYGPPKQPLQDVPLDSYLPPNKPLRDDVATYGPPKQPLQDVPLDSYLPPNKPLRDDVATYGPPKQPLQDVPLDSYLPPNQPLRADLATYGPPKQPLQDVPLDSYLPPNQPLRADLANYGPPKQPLRDDLATYVPPKQPLRDDSATYGPPKQPLQDVPLDSYLPPSKQPLPSLSYGPALHQDNPLGTYVPPKEPLRDDAASDSYLPPKLPLGGDDLATQAPAKDVYRTRGVDEDITHGDGVKGLPQLAQPRHLSSVLRAGSVDEHGIRVTDMSCLRTATRARFTATISSPAFVPWPPVLEVVSGGGAASTGCRIIADPADPHHRFLVDLSNPDLSRCGVKGCSADGEARLCSRVVLPSLPGLRLASDPVLLLQCALQPATGSVLQQARVAAAQPAAGRSAGVVHAGGERAPLHAHLLLFRRGAAGEFSRQMQAGGAVLLGDELQLRAAIRRGDGWQSSRLSDVVVRRGSDAVQLVAADGCPNADMRAVCPRPQAWLTGEPLVSLLNMRVFMFRGMSDGDQLVLTARVVACLDRADCKLSMESCEATGHSARVKRSTSQHSNITTTFEGSVSFVVQLRGAHQPHVLDALPSVGQLPVVVVAVAAVVLSAATAISVLICGRT